MGYMYNESATISTIDSSGFLHSGDIGFIDSSSGFLTITGRIKELIITAGGENIPCPRIETCIKDNMDAIARGLLSNVMLVGDERRFLTLLVTLQTKENSTSQLVCLLL